MPNFNRRGFLYLLSAAGVAPLMPALPARAAAATASGSVSKALWASIYAKSGSASKFVGVARNMGLSNAAIQGVSARSVGVRVAVAAAANPITHTAGSHSAKGPWQTKRLDMFRDVVRDTESAISIEADEEVEVADLDATPLDAISDVNDSRNDTP